MKPLGVALATAAALVLGVNIAGAKALNFEANLTVQVDHLPPMVTTGGGVATLNRANGELPAPLVSLPPAASRGNLTGTQTVVVTSPGTIAGAKAIIGQFQLGTGTLAPISRAKTSPVLTKGVLPVGGVLKFCQLSAACTSFVPLM